MGSKTKIIAFFLLFCLIIPLVLAQENPQMIAVFNNVEEVPERPSDDIEFNGITIISIYVCRFTPESEDTTSCILDFGDEYSAAKLIDLKYILRNRSVINRYLFSWDKVPGNHSKTLLKNLRYYFNFKWTENASINKSRDNMTINISKDNKHRAEIIMDEKNENATIKVGDNIYHLEVRTENGTVNLYSDYDRVDKDIFPNSFLAKKPFVRYELKPFEVKNWKVNNVTLTGSIRVHATIFKPGYCSICLVFPIITEDLNINSQNFLIADKPLKTDDIVEMFEGKIPLNITYEGRDKVNTTKRAIFENEYNKLKNKFFVENGKNGEPRPYRVAYAWNITNFFCWDEVPGNHSETLLKKIIRDDLKLKWAENATINKSPDNRSINITKDNNTAEIIMDKKNETATIKVDDKIIHILKVRTENGTLTLSTNTSKTARKLVEENPWEVCGICAPTKRWDEIRSRDHIFSVVSEVFQKNPDDIQFFYPEGYGFFVYDQNPKALQDYGYNPYFVRRAELIYLQAFMLETYNNEIGEELEELRDVKEDKYPDKIKDIANLKREIFIALDQFYLIEDSIRYGVNIVFMRYGKQTLGLDITYAYLRDKMEDISKISEDMYNVHTQESMRDLTKRMKTLTILVSFLTFILVFLEVYDQICRFRERRAKK